MYLRSILNYVSFRAKEIRDEIQAVLSYCPVNGKVLDFNNLRILNEADINNPEHIRMLLMTMLFGNDPCTIPSDLDGLVKLYNFDKDQFESILTDFVEKISKKGTSLENRYIEIKKYLFESERSPKALSKEQRLMISHFNNLGFRPEQYAFLVERTTDQIVEHLKSIKLDPVQSRIEAELIDIISYISAINERKRISSLYNYEDDMAKVKLLKNVTSTNIMSIRKYLFNQLFFFNRLNIQAYYQPTTVQKMAELYDIDASKITEVLLKYVNDILPSGLTSNADKLKWLIENYKTKEYIHKEKRGIYELEIEDFLIKSDVQTRAISLIIQRDYGNVCAKKNKYLNKAEKHEKLTTSKVDDLQPVVEFKPDNESKVTLDDKSEMVFTDTDENTNDVIAETTDKHVANNEEPVVGSVNATNNKVMVEIDIDELLNRNNELMAENIKLKTQLKLIKTLLFDSGINFDI